MSFLRATSVATNLSTSKKSEYEGNTFFIFDHTVLKKEEDDLKDAIIYYFPNVDHDSQCALVGQIIGMSEFFYNTIPRSRPNIIKLYHNKFVLRQRGDYTFGLGGKKSHPDSSLEKQIDFLLDTFVFYQGSLDALKENLGSGFLSGLKLLWDIYLPFCENVGDVVGQMFQMLPTVNIPKSSSQLFLHASHILQRSVLDNNVLAGAVLYRNQCLCSQLPPNITKRLLLLKPRQTHITRAKVKTSYELPQGIQLLKVFLKTQEYDNICPRKRTSLRKKHTVRDLNKISKESVGIEEISFLECDSGKQQDLNRVEKSSVKINESQKNNQVDKSGLRCESESEVNKESDSFLTASDQDDAKEVHACSSPLSLLELTAAFIKQNESLDSSHGDGVQADLKRDVFTSETDTSSLVFEDERGASKQGAVSGSPQNLDNSIQDCPKLDQTSENITFSSQVSSPNSGNGETKLDARETHFASTSLKSSFTPEQSPIRQEISLDTTSSEDLSMGESCVDPREVKKHAKQLLKESKQTVKYDNEIQIHGSSTSLNTKEPETKTCDMNTTNPMDQTTPIGSTDSVDVAVVFSSSKPDNKTVQFDADSGIVNSTEFQQPTVVNSSVVPTTLDVITDEDENKFIKSSGSSFTSDETQNTETIGASATESLASLESMSMSPPLSRKKSVTFSKTKSSSRNSPSIVSNVASEIKGWDPSSDDLLDVVLYAQGHSDMMILLFLEIGTKCEQKFITNLWKSSVSYLADLDYEVKECLSKEKRDRKTSKTGENYQYLKYDSLMQTMSGNSLEPISSVGYDFINTASKIHDSFLSSKTTTQVLLRSHTAACYGCQSVHNETFFQTNPTTREHGGCPSPKDIVFTLDSLAASKLETKHNETLL